MAFYSEQCATLLETDKNIPCRIYFYFKIYFARYINCNMHSDSQEYSHNMNVLHSSPNISYLFITYTQACAP